MTPLWRPPHAYVPGQTPRHPDGLFDPLKEGLDPARFADSPAFQAGLGFLQDGYFWEAHEVLEPVWLALPPNSADRLALQALIALANAGLKARMGRPAAASRLRDQARRLWAEAEQRGAMVDLPFEFA